MDPSLPRVSRFPSTRGVAVARSLAGCDGVGGTPVFIRSDAARRGRCVAVGAARGDRRGRPWQQQVVRAGSESVGRDHCQRRLKTDPPRDGVHFPGLVQQLPPRPDGRFGELRKKDKLYDSGRSRSLVDPGGHRVGDRLAPSPQGPVLPSHRRGAHAVAGGRTAPVGHGSRGGVQPGNRRWYLPVSCGSTVDARSCGIASSTAPPSVSTVLPP